MKKEELVFEGFILNCKWSSTRPPGKGEVFPGKG